ncbi:MAG TPA: radical SAM family heme chaperone HemW [Bacteroidales bacterium]|nr:radical SAM family heme chaperone HemW [Bacteroidales bacterium]
MAGIYVHIPFCKQKCIYCGFFSIASPLKTQEILDNIIIEAYLRQNYCDNEIIETIYFGGGTPSILSIQQITKILQNLKKIFSISKNAELTIEANPEDITYEKVKQWQEIGFNRVSIGIQSFDDNILKQLNRRHNSIMAKKAIENVFKIGLLNVSADIMFGMPYYSDETLVNSLNVLIDYKVPHISTYALTIEQNTALDLMIKKMKMPYPDEEQIVKQFLIIIDIMSKANYINYEISNYAKEGFFSIHNSNYWKNKQYLGLGPSAHSYNINSRQWNVANIDIYIKSIQNKVIPCEIEILTETQKLNEYIMTSLRTIWGLNTLFVKENYGDDAYQNIIKLAQPFLEKKLMIMNDNVLLLSDNGKLLADKITADLFFMDK